MRRNIDFAFPNSSANFLKMWPGGFLLTVPSSSPMTVEPFKLINTNNYNLGKSHSFFYQIQKKNTNVVAGKNTEENRHRFLKHTFQDHGLCGLVQEDRRHGRSPLKTVESNF